MQTGLPVFFNRGTGKIRWVDIPNVTGWTFERFEVLHDESVEPHGCLRNMRSD